MSSGRDNRYIVCQILFPNRRLVYPKVEGVVLPGFLGQLQILPEHSEAFFLLKEGDVVVQRVGGKKELLKVKGGVCFFQSNNLVIVVGTGLEVDSF